MYKKIIFDIDNTLIKWNKDESNSIKKALDELNITYDEKNFKMIEEAIEDYEYKYDILTKQDMLNFINKFSKMNLDMNFMDTYFKYLKLEEVDINNDIIETLKYLKEKYELVALSNWFLDQQIIRLEKAKILEYFTNIYAADDYYLKPNENAFLRAMGNNSISECIVVGDNYDIDIEIPKALGMKTFYVNNTNINNSISSVVELKNLL